MKQSEIEACRVVKGLLPVRSYWWVVSHLIFIHYEVVFLYKSLLLSKCTNGACAIDSLQEVIVYWWAAHRFNPFQLTRTGHIYTLYKQETHCYKVNLLHFAFNWRSNSRTVAMKWLNLSKKMIEWNCNGLGEKRNVTIYLRVLFWYKLVKDKNFIFSCHTTKHNLSWLNILPWVPYNTLCLPSKFGIFYCFQHKCSWEYAVFPEA